MRRGLITVLGSQHLLIVDTLFHIVEEHALLDHVGKFQRGDLRFVCGDLTKEFCIIHDVAICNYIIVAPS